MAKKVNCFELAKVKCKECGKLLKVNVINRKPNATLCYPCYHRIAIETREGYHGKGRNDRRFEEQR